MVKFTGSLTKNELVVRDSRALSQTVCDEEPHIASVTIQSKDVSSISVNSVETKC